MLAVRCFRALAQRGRAQENQPCSGEHRGPGGPGAESWDNLEVPSLEAIKDQGTSSPCGEGPQDTDAAPGPAGESSQVRLAKAVRGEMMVPTGTAGTLFPAHRDEAEGRGSAHSTGLGRGAPWGQEHLAVPGTEQGALGDWRSCPLETCTAVAVSLVRRRQILDEDS